MTSFQLVLLRGVFPKYIMEHSKAMAGFRLFVTMIRTRLLVGKDGCDITPSHRGWEGQGSTLAMGWSLLSS